MVDFNLLAAFFILSKREAPVDVEVQDEEAAEANDAVDDEFG